MTRPKNKDVYNATIKLFGSEPEPAFEESRRLEALWGRAWGCDNDIGQIRAVMMHRPGQEFDVIDPAKRIEETGSFGDLEAGWYWQSETIPPLAEMQAQHDRLADAVRAEGAEVIYVDGVEGGRFKSVYTRDSSFAVKGGAIVARLAPRMRHGEELPVTRALAKLGMPILRTVHGTGMIEGGSFAWLNSKTAVVGRGIRVNDDGIAQVAEVLKYQGVELIVVDLRGYDIHIDGHFVMVDVNLALVWPRGLSFSFLERLKELAVQMEESLDEVAALAAKLKEADTNRRRLQEEILPEAMRDDMRDHFQLPSGKYMVLKNEIKARIPKNGEEEAYAFLEDIGEGGMIKRLITCEFRRDQEEDATAALEALRHAGFHQANVKRTHAWNTFQSWVTKQMKDGKSLPMELFGIHERDVAKVKDSL